MAAESVRLGLEHVCGVIASGARRPLPVSTGSED
jgi:hypothetical protein